MLTEICKRWKEFPRLLSLPSTSVVMPEYWMNRNFLDLPQVFELAFNSYASYGRLCRRRVLRSIKSAAGGKTGPRGCVGVS